jgi:hypothetical protein
VNCAFEFHDSRLVEFERREDGTGYLLFRGSVYRAQGELFQAGQESGFQFVRVDFTGMHVNGPVVLDERCSGGSISLDGQLTDDVIYLPLDQEGPVQITLQLSPRSEITVVDAQSIRVELEGEFERERVWEEDDIEDDIEGGVQ